MSTEKVAIEDNYKLHEEYLEHARPIQDGRMAMPAKKFTSSEENRLYTKMDIRVRRSSPSGFQKREIIMCHVFELTLLRAADLTHARSAVLVVVHGCVPGSPAEHWQMSRIYFLSLIRTLPCYFLRRCLPRRIQRLPLKHRPRQHRQCSM